MKPANAAKICNGFMLATSFSFLVSRFSFFVARDSNNCDPQAVKLTPGARGAPRSTNKPALHSNWTSNE
jgi:hypothetical protein